MGPGPPAGCGVCLGREEGRAPGACRAKASGRGADTVTTKGLSARLCGRFGAWLLSLVNQSLARRNKASVFFVRKTLTMRKRLLYCRAA